MESTELMHDYRQDIVQRKRERRCWSEWDKWSILYKTLAYELSSSGDVESYVYVREKAFEKYEDYLECVGKDFTADIMNGWWYCFKTIFNIESSRRSEETRNLLKEILRKIKDCQDDEAVKKVLREENMIDVSISDDVIDSFFDFLKVVYTVGNITPVPQGGNVHGDALDSWEYKLFVSNAGRFKDNYNVILHFEDYSDCSKWWDRIKEVKNDRNKTIGIICEYMSNRTDLIKKRGARILKIKNI